MLWVWCQHCSWIPSFKPQRPGNDTVQCSVRSFLSWQVHASPTDLHQLLQDCMFFHFAFFYSNPCCSIYFPWLLWPGPANAHKKGLGKGQKGLEKGQQEEESSTSSSNSDQSSPSTDGEKGKGAPKGARPKAKGKGGAKAAPEVKKEVDQGNGDWVQVVKKGNRRKK